MKSSPCLGLHDFYMVEQYKYISCQQHKQAKQDFNMGM